MPFKKYHQKRIYAEDVKFYDIIRSFSFCNHQCFCTFAQVFAKESTTHSRILPTKRFPMELLSLILIDKGISNECKKNYP